ANGDHGEKKELEEREGVKGRGEEDRRKQEDLVRRGLEDSKKREAIIKGAITVIKKILTLEKC
ncbi:hypothetical protein, partial [Klebsiella variicola]|uniref:hypothetical protein n=1 Tax=Klebsiella variicola TaxID=244366 RepID=UPI0027314F08